MSAAPCRTFARSLAGSRQAVQLALARFRLARCADAASNLAFTTLIAIVPLIAIAFAIVSAFPIFETVTSQLQSFVTSTLLPETAEKVLSIYLTEFAANAAQVSVLGLIVLVVTAVVLVLTIEGAFDDIWQTGSGGRQVPRLAAYGLLVTAGPILIGIGLWLTSLVVSFSLGWFAYLDHAVLLVLSVAPFALTITAFAMLYYTLPNVPVRLSDAFTGGLVAGALFEVAKRGFGLYVTHIGGYNAIYGAFATLPIFLVWVYLSWLVVLCGAVLVAVMPQVRASSTPAEASGMTLPAGDSADASPGAPSGAAVQIRADDEAAQAQRERVSEG